MFRKKMILRSEAPADGGDGGGGGSANTITPSKWSIPDGAVEYEAPSGGDGGDDGGGDDGNSNPPAGSEGAQGAASPDGTQKPDTTQAPQGGDGAQGGAEGTQAKSADATEGAQTPPANAEGDQGGEGAAPESPMDFGDLPPFIRDAIKSHKEGKFNQEEFIQKYQGLGDIDTAPSENIIREYYSRKYGIKSEENPNGVTEEEIDTYIKSQKEQKLLDFTAREFRPQLKNLMEQEREEIYNRDYQTFAETQEKNLNDLFAKTANYDNIYGVKVSKSDLQEFNQELKGFLLPEKGEQLQPIYVTEKLSELLSNDETLYQMLYAATKSPKIKEALSGAKESTKRNIESKLGLTPNVGSGSPSAHNSGTITPGLWAMPDET